MLGLIIVLALAILVAAVCVLTYNGLIGARNEVKNSLNQIDVQLKRRHDLIPNLIETAKGYMTHERQTLDSVTQARSQAQQAGSQQQKFQQEQGLSQALGHFMAVSEGYPDLKASGTFQTLQEELASTENRIAFARQRYNDVVMQYDTRRQGFPGMLLAGTARCGDEPYWAIDDSKERATPQVKF